MPRFNARQLGQFRRLLQARKAALHDEIRAEMVRAGNETYGEIAGDVPDSGDEAVATLLADMDHALAGRLIGELRDIEAAFRRIDEGSYGACVDCGGDIDVERLKAYPTAKRCLACQALHEKTYFQEGTPTL